MTEVKSISKRLDQVDKMLDCDLCAELRTSVIPGDVASEAAARIEAGSLDAMRLDWLEQHEWENAETCLNLINSWRTSDGNRHGAGLHAAIDAEMSNIALANQPAPDKGA